MQHRTGKSLKVMELFALIGFAIIWIYSIFLIALIVLRKTRIHY